MESALAAIAAESAAAQLRSRQAVDAAKSAHEHAAAVRKQWGFVNAHLGSIERRLIRVTGVAYSPARGEVSVMEELKAFAAAEGLPPLDNTEPN